MSRYLRTGMFTVIDKKRIHRVVRDTSFWTGKPLVRIMYYHEYEDMETFVKPIWNWTSMVFQTQDECDVAYELLKLEIPAKDSDRIELWN